METEQNKKDHEVAFVINGELAVVPHEQVSFAEIVSIAYPVPPADGTTFTAVYRKAKSTPHSGNLAEGDVIVVRKEGTEFDVYATGRS